MIKSKSSVLSQDNCNCKDHKKLVKALREYDKLLNIMLFDERETKEENVEKLFKRSSRMSEINHLYMHIIFKELDDAFKYFREMDILLTHKSKAYSYYGLKSKCKEINLRDSSGATPLLLAVLNNSYILVELLLTHGANHTLRYRDKMTILHIASKQNNFEIVKLILDFESYMESAQRIKVFLHLKP